MEGVYINRSVSTGAQDYAEIDYGRIIGNPNMMRRMSLMIKHAVAAGLMCLGDTAPEEMDAVITATSLGGMEDTEKFLEEITERNEESLNPTPFMRSTFNTVGGQIALLKGIKAYNVTYVHRAHGFESALTDAMLHIAEGKKKVLVGAFDEITENCHLVKERAGMFRNGMKEGEGSSFFLLGSAPEGESAAEILDVRIMRHESAGAEEYLRSKGLDPRLVEMTGNEIKNECGDFGTVSSYMLHKALTGGSGKEYALVYNDSVYGSKSFILLRRCWQS